MQKNNIFKHIPIDKKDEKFIELLKTSSIKVEKIVSNGQKSPENFWYDQDESEFVLLLKGHAILEFEDCEIELKEGDFIDIKARKKHRVKYTSQSEPTIWLAIFY